MFAVARKKKFLRAGHCMAEMRGQALFTEFRHIQRRDPNVELQGAGQDRQVGGNHVMVGFKRGR